MRLLLLTPVGTTVHVHEAAAEAGLQSSVKLQKLSV